MKTLLVRHYGILWTISVMWEITEVSILCIHLVSPFNTFYFEVVTLSLQGVSICFQFLFHVSHEILSFLFRCRIFSFLLGAVNIACIAFVI